MYTGHNVVSKLLTESMVGFKIGEYALTKKFDGQAQTKRKTKRKTKKHLKKK
jgi:ribosomal protein S19